MIMPTDRSHEMLCKLAQYFFSKRASRAVRNQRWYVFLHRCVPSKLNRGEDALCGYLQRGTSHIYD